MYLVFFSRWFFVGWLMTLFVCGGASLPTASAQIDDLLGSGPTGPTGITDETTASPAEETEWAPGGVTNSPYTGPIGQVDNREPHDACENCFTIPGLGEGYTILESVPVGEDSEHVILREIPNPAPLEDGEIRSSVDDAGEALWYIGTQAYSGPYDTDPVSDGYNMPLIELKRMRARNEDTIMDIPGVHGFGIVATGFGVWILPTGDAAAIPETIEGVPVTVFVEEMLEKKVFPYK